MKDIVVTICAVVGAILGVINFWKALKKEKKEAQTRAKQHLVKAKYKIERPHGMPMDFLYVVNADTLSVTDVVAHFYDKEQECKDTKKILSLGPDEEHLIQKFNIGGNGYKSVEFEYVDASGYIHKYKQEAIV